MHFTITVQLSICLFCPKLFIQTYHNIFRQSIILMLTTMQHNKMLSSFHGILIFNYWSLKMVEGSHIPANFYLFVAMLGFSRGDWSISRLNNLKDFSKINFTENNELILISLFVSIYDFFIFKFVYNIKTVVSYVDALVPPAPPNDLVQKNWYLLVRSWYFVSVGGGCTQVGWWTPFTIFMINQDFYGTSKKKY